MAGPARSRTVAAAFTRAILVTSAVALGVSGCDSTDSGLVNLGPSEGLSVNDIDTLNSGKRHPVLLPTRLPPGDTDTGFLAGLPLTDPRAGRAGAGWSTLFLPDRLPPRSGELSGYVVLQAPINFGPGQASSCGPKASGKRVERQFEQMLLTICLGPDPTPEAVQYWKEVPFSSDPKDVEWLID